MIFCYYILSKIYAFIIYVWHTLYNLGILSSSRFTTPIISIGNITVGGTGKTPTVIFLSKLLTRHNISHAIVSRGYKKTSAGMIVITKENIKNILPHQCGDEPYMMAKKLENIPIVVNKNKNNAIKHVIKTINPQLILLDDGFQSLKIYRDLDIVLINSICTRQNFSLLPLGKLREPLKNLHRTNLIIYSKKNLSKSIGQQFLIKKYITSNISNSIPYMESNITARVLFYNRKIMQLELFTSYQKINFTLGFCGIGDPQSFSQISNDFFNLNELISFADHHQYTNKDLRGLLEKCKKKKIDSIITTYKDFVKIEHLYNNQVKSFNIKLFVIDIDIDITNEKLLMKKINNLF